MEATKPRALHNTTPIANAGKLAPAILANALADNPCSHNRAQKGDNLALFLRQEDANLSSFGYRTPFLCYKGEAPLLPLPGGRATPSLRVEEAAPPLSESKKLPPLLSCNKEAPRPLLAPHPRKNKQARSRHPLLRLQREGCMAGLPPNKEEGSIFPWFIDMAMGRRGKGGAPLCVPSAFVCVLRL